MEELNLSYIDIVLASGMWAIPMLICFFYSLYLIQQKHQSLQIENSLDPMEITNNIESYITKSNWEKAISLCAKYDTALGRILKVALLSAFQKKPSLEIRNDIDTQTQVEVPLIFSNIQYISSLSKCCILLAFLASMTNMIFCLLNIMQASVWERSEILLTSYISAASSLCLGILLFLILFLLQSYVERSAHQAVSKIRVSSSKMISLIDLYTEKLS